MARLASLPLFYCALATILAIVSFTVQAAPAATPQNGGSSTDHLEYVSAGWYPAWKSTEFPPSKISWDMYDMVTFAFALTTEDPSKLDLAGEDKTLTAFATEAKSRGVKSLLSVGGWTGSMYFSTHMATQKGRDTFRKAITDMVTQYKLDGIDFDWEHPNQKGACNAFAPQDTANFLSFLKDLRADPAGKDLILTAAASISPFFDANGVPSTNLAPFGEVFDYLAIMAYDIYGSWSPTTGPNAPLYSTCAGDKAVGSGESSVKAWTAAGFPIKKLLLGVAAYGRSWHVDTANAMTGNALNQYATFDATIKPLGEGEADSTVYGVDKCGEQEGPTGIWDFNGLIDAGWLMSDGEASQSHAKYLFDDCSKTPFLYNETSQTMISYDNAESFAEKGKFIYDNKLGGFAVWHILGDSSDNILLDSIHKAIGYTVECTDEDPSTTTTPASTDDAATCTPVTKTASTTAPTEAQDAATSTSESSPIPTAESTSTADSPEATPTTDESPEATSTTEETTEATPTAEQSVGGGGNY